MVTKRLEAKSLLGREIFSSRAPSEVGWSSRHVWCFSILFQSPSNWCGTDMTSPPSSTKDGRSTVLSPQEQESATVAEQKTFLSSGARLTALGMLAGNVAPVLVILLARAFPPEVFGLYVSLQLFVLTTSKLTSLGLDRGLTWWFAHHRSTPEVGLRALNASSWTVLGLSLVVLGLVIGAHATGLLGLAPGMANVDGIFVIACFSALPAWTLLHIHAGSLDGVKRPEFRIFLNQAFVYALAPCISLALLFLGFDRWALPAGLIASNVIGLVLIVTATKRIMPGMVYWPIARPDRRLLRYSFPLCLNELLAGLLLRADLWMLLLILGPTPAAVYAVMSTLSAGVRAVRQGYDQMIIPVVGAMQGRSRLAEVFSFAAHRISSIQLAIAVVVLLFPAELLLLAGKDYVVEPQALSVLLVSQLVQGFLGLSGVVVLGLGQSRPLLQNSLLSLVINVTLNAVLISRYGITGAAFATTAALALSSIVLVGVQVRLTGSWLFQKRLVPNALLILALSVTALGYQSSLAPLPILVRVLLGLLLLAVVAGHYVWSNRKYAD